MDTKSEQAPVETKLITDIPGKATSEPVANEAKTKAVDLPVEQPQSTPKPEQAAAEPTHEPAATDVPAPKPIVAAVTSAKAPIDRTPMLTAMIAMIVFVVLAGAAYYAYAKSN